MMREKHLVWGHLVAGGGVAMGSRSEKLEVGSCPFEVLSRRIRQLTEGWVERGVCVVSEDYL